MSTLTDLKKKVRDYFNPTSNQGNNFWNSNNPLIQGVVNSMVGVQKFGQSVPQKVEKTLVNKGYIYPKEIRGSNMTPEKYSEYHKQNPSLETKIATNPYVVNRYAEPIFSIPSNIKKIGTPGKRLGGTLGALAGVGALFPDPVGDVALPALDFAKGYGASAKTGGTLKENLKSGKEALTLEKPVGMGDVFGNTPEEITAGNIAEIPLILLAGGVKSKSTEKAVMSEIEKLSKLKKLTKNQATRLEGLQALVKEGDQTIKKLKVFRGRDALSSDSRPLRFFTDDEGLATRYADLANKAGRKGEVISEDIGGLKLKNTTQKKYLDLIDDPEVLKEYDGIMFKNSQGSTTYAVFNKPAGSKPRGATGENVLSFMRTDRQAINTGEILSELGADTPKAKFAEWVNTRRASTVEGILKGREFSDLDKKGMQGVFEFQAGNKSPRYAELRKYFDNKYEIMQKEGVRFNYKKDYLTQIWKEPEETVDKVFRSLGTKPGFTLDSIIKNYEEGISAGLTPKYNKISDIVSSYERATNKAIADHQFFRYLVNDNLIMRANAAPRDWITLNPDRFPRTSVSTPLGNYTGTYKAPPEYGNMINNYLNDANFKWLEKVADATSVIKNRVLSFGIPGTAINAHGFNILARNVFSSKNPVRGAITGIEYMINPAAAAKKMDITLKRAPDAIKNGLTLSTNEFKSVMEEPAGFRSQFGDMWNKLFERGLFEKMLPSLKLQKYEEVYRGFIKSGVDEKEAGKLAAKFTNDVFGGINWEELGKSRDMNNLLRATILAPDWLQTNINLAKNLTKSAVKLGDPKLSAYRRFLATFLGTYVTMNVINKISSGHFMVENEGNNKFNIEAGFTGDGQKRYIRPFGTAADFIRLPQEILASLAGGDASQIGRIVRNRLSIPAGVGVGFLTDTDYTGQPIGYRGEDKYGNEMPAKQRAMGIGGELATLAGMPAFSKQGLDFLSGKTGGEQALLQGLELPLRYSGGVRSNIQKQAQEIEPLKGKELYERNKLLQGQTMLSEGQLEKVRAGETTIENILSTRNANRINQIRKDYSRGEITKESAIEKINEISPIKYDTSADSPEGIKKTLVNIESFAANPVETIKLWQKGEPIRKVRLSGDTTFEQAINFFDSITVSERASNLGKLDDGNKGTQVDHIKSKWLGGREDVSNYQILTLAEHAKKTELDNKLLKQFEAGDITKEEAWEQLQEFNKSLNGRGITEDQLYSLSLETILPKTANKKVTTKKTTSSKKASKKKGVKVSMPKISVAKISSTRSSAKIPTLNVKALPKAKLTQPKKASLNFIEKKYTGKKPKKFTNTLSGGSIKLG